MKSGSVPTLMLEVFKLVKILIPANMYGMCSTGIVHQLLKRKVVVKHTNTKFLLEKYALTQLNITVCCCNHAFVSVPTRC